MDGVEVAALVGVQRRFQQQPGHRDHAVHRRADFVAHRREKFRLCPRAGLGGDPRCVQLVLVLQHFVEPQLRLQCHPQARAKFRRFQRLAHAIARAQFKRTQPLRRFRREHDDRDILRGHIILDLAQQFRLFRVEQDRIGRPVVKKPPRLVRGECETRRSAVILQSG